MKINNTLTDESILTEIGERIARRRLDLQLTQAALAKQSGVAKRTVERIEAGASAQMSSMIRILRVLDLLQNLDHLFPEAVPGPMDLLMHKGKTRRRASGVREPTGPVKPWTWDEKT